jgi:subtilase family serine protease
MFTRFQSRFRVIVLILFTVVCTSSEAIAQTTRQLVTQVVDERQTIELAGNIRPEASAQNDLGRVDDTLALDHMQLLLKRPTETEAALVRFIDLLHDPKSPYFHQWLTAEQFRANFGPADADVSMVSNWLSRHGLTVNGVQAGGMVIDFSGTAGQIRDAFKTEIHRLDVGGVGHVANMSNPRIPAALSDVVNGIVSLNNFRPHTNFKSRPEYTYTSGSSTYHAVAPADLATIYNLNPMFRSGISGQGQTIVVIENTNVYSPADWTTFRSTFGLSSYTSGSFTQIHPVPASGANNCTNPGVVAGNEREAELDAEWASAAAPGAAVVLASCGDTSTTFGGLIALQNLVNSSNPPAIISISYGECEAMNGATANAAYSSVYQQAVARGISVFVSAGDEGAASCDADLGNATHGIGVSGFASTPYNVAVGGTDFGDTYARTTASYWTAANAATYGSAISYVPEIPWNDSCASVLIAAANGYRTTYGTTGFCNSPTGNANYLTTASGSGGPSGCAAGTPSVSGVVSGTCRGYAKPVWQTLLLLLGNPADGVRDLPDVSLFAANGVWGHYYIVCDSDVPDGGAACTGAPSGWAGGGGTSFAAPIWAGFQALVNQATGSRQGNPNPVYYSLAATEYLSGGTSTCNSSRGNGVASNCVFYDITLGDIDVNCSGTNDCYRPSGNYGVLSTRNSSYSKAYGTGAGWNFATGIGTVNVTNLVNAWPR